MVLRTDRCLAWDECFRDLFSLQQRYEEAAKCFKEGLRVDGGSESGQLRLCAAMRNLGLVEVAVAGAFKLVHNNADSVAAREELGLLLLVLSRPHEAVPHLHFVPTSSSSQPSKWGCLLGGVLHLLNCEFESTPHPVLLILILTHGR